MARTHDIPKSAGIGIDFGTTNSVVATSDKSRPKPRTKALLDKSSPHPSVVWYKVGGEPEVGRKAKDNILGSADATGHFFISSVKRELGKERSYSIFGAKRHATEVAAEIFSHLKADAKKNHNLEVEEAVVTIPIEFDGRARRDLRKAANLAGIHIKTFVHEPFAAIVGYCCSERSPKQLADREGETCLVFDWGGGTLDITVTRIEGRTISELATAGIPNRSGDHFDETLANFAKTEFIERNQIAVEQFVLQPGTKDRLRRECELGKIKLSEEDELMIGLMDFYRSNGKPFNLEEFINREKFEELIQADVNDAMAKVDHVLERAGLRSTDIDLALLIGGTSRIPRIQKEMSDRFGTRMVRVENADSIIAEGAAIVDALNLHPVLARPICIELSDGKPYEIFKAGSLAKPESCTKKVALFCTDNRDGQARLIVKEGFGPNNANFVTKCVVPVAVCDSIPKPYNHERVTANFLLDEDLVLKISAVGAINPQVAEAEIHDLCFALKLFEE